ncbi:MAG: SLBB domain-containing protein [Sporomusaceae bacterium]|nr:SLBB domain-containing protein [Sporomusaceae bacterium]
MDTYQKRLILGVVFLTLAVGAAFVFSPGSKADPGNAVTSLAENSAPKSAKMGKEAYVYITGAVNHPGVYPLTTQKRVSEALMLAGGLSPEADDSKVNLVKPVKDGMHIHVPARHEKAAPKVRTNAGVEENQTENLVTLISVNTGTKEELLTVKGMTPTMADQLIFYRQVHGNFSSLDMLANVKGFTVHKIKKMQNQLSL